MGLPETYVEWIQIIYSGAKTVVRHKNWLMSCFDMDRGVCQGCLLSCYLFNLVGQVLVYSLRQQGLFAWWSKPGDPCSLYADDMALFFC